MAVDAPDKLVAARKGSPLVIGIGQGEFFLASDATPIVEFTKEVVYLNDQEVAVIEGNKLAVKDTSNLPLTQYIQKVDMDLEAIEKGGFDHFMLTEIFEKPTTISDCMLGDRKSVGKGKSGTARVDHGSSRIYPKKKKKN